MKLAAVCVSALCAVASAGWYSHEAKHLAYGVESTSSGYAPLAPNVTQHSGYVAVNRAGDVPGHLFYWLFEAQESPETAPLILWLTGGPGCSSELAILKENGPARMEEDGSWKPNPGSWNTFANVLYVDQPVGTGFSYAEGSYVANEDEVAQDMYDFLQSFFAQYPQYAKAAFAVTGESYAGHYVPAITAKIVEENAKGSAPAINMQFMAIGNGLTDPRIQYTQYADFAHQAGIVTDSQWASLNETTQQCIQAIDSKSPFALYTCNALISTIQQDCGNCNVYNYKIPCSKPPLCYDFSAVDALMAKADVLQSLGIDTSKSSWTECNNDVHSALMGDWMNNLEVKVPSILKAGVRVMIYAGVLDIICNYLGNRAWANAMEWEGKAAFNAEPLKPWSAAGQQAGVFKTASNFTFVEVDGAGHLVPMDQPISSLTMIRNFVTDTPFAAAPTAAAAGAAEAAAVAMA